MKKQLSEEKVKEILVLILLGILFVQYGVLPMLYLGFEYIVNPIVRKIDGYEPYTPPECWEALYNSTSSPMYLIPDYCRWEKDYNPIG